MQPGRTPRVGRVICAAAAALALVGCDSNPQGGVASVSPLPSWMHGEPPLKPALCAVDGKKIDRSIRPSTFRGDWIGFCSPECKAKFDASPLQYADNIGRLHGAP